MRHLSADGIRYYGSKLDLLHWLNARVPVIVVVCDDAANVCYWQVVSDHTVIATAKGWQMNIPLENRLDPASRETLQRLATSGGPYLSASLVTRVLDPWREHPGWGDDVRLWSFTGTVAQDPVDNEERRGTAEHPVQVKIGVHLLIEDTSSGAKVPNKPVDIPDPRFRCARGDTISVIYAGRDEHYAFIVGALNLTAAYDGVAMVRQQWLRLYPNNARVGFAVGASALAAGTGGLLLSHNAYGMAAAIPAAIAVALLLRRYAVAPAIGEDRLVTLFDELRDG